LAGLSIESQYWKEYFWKLKNLRQEIVKEYGLIKLNELKGSDIFSHRGPFFNSLITPTDLANIYENIIELICDPLTNLFVVVQSKKEFLKHQSYKNPKSIIKIFNERVWFEYLSMYEHFLIEKANRCECAQTALIYSDVTSSQEKYIRRATKKFSIRFSHHSKYPGTGIVEDVIFRDSMSSYFIQFADILAFSMNRIMMTTKKEDVITVKPEIVNKLKKKIHLKSNIPDTMEKGTPNISSE